MRKIHIFTYFTAVFIPILFLYALLFRDLEYITACKLTIHPQSEPVSIVDDRFLSFGLDTSEIASDIDKLHLDTALLQNLTSLLGPSYLRLGGTMSDRLLFMEYPNFENTSKPAIRNCNEDELCLAKFLPFFVMSGNDWLKINKFCTDTGTRMLFDFNVLLRHNNEWDPSDAESLLKFTTKMNIQENIDWQLGNEPNSFQHVFNVSIPPQQLSKDFMMLKKLLQMYVPNSKLVGPDTTRPQPQRPECVQYMKEFLDGFQSNDSTDGPEHYLGAIAWHQYYLNGRIATVQDFWNPDTFDLLKSQIDTMIENINEHLDTLPMWLTETSSAYGGGAPGLSNSYASTALWLDKLGLAASKGIKLIVRQSLIGGNYSLIGKDLSPLPDWWVSYIYRKLVGRRVISCNSNASKYLRLYCHCSQDETESNGSVTVFGINLSKDPSYIVLAGLPSDIYVEEYILSSPAMDRLSKSITLNGIILSYNGSVPNIIPLIRDIHDRLKLPGYSIGFWVVRNAEMKACN